MLELCVNKNVVTIRTGLPYLSKGRMIMSFAAWFSELRNNSEKVRQFMDVFGQATDKNILEGGSEVDPYWECGSR